MKQKKEQEKSEEQSGLYEFTKFAEKLSRVTEDYREDKERKSEIKYDCIGCGKKTSNSERICSDTCKEIVENALQKPIPAPEKRYRNRGERISEEDLKEKILNYIQLHQPCILIMNKKTGNFPEELLNFINYYNNSKIRKCLISLTEEKRVTRTREKQGNQGRTPFVYCVRNEKVKPDNSKALEYFKEKIEEEEDEEDMLDVPSPERGPRREIKRKCLKCGGQLWKRNTKEDNYLDSESRFMDGLKEFYYQCFQCGSIFKEKEFKEEAIAA